MKLTKDNIRLARMGVVRYLMLHGITDNADIVSVVKPLTSHDKLRGVKRSLTVTANNNALRKAKEATKPIFAVGKPAAALSQQKGKNLVNKVILVKAKVRTDEPAVKNNKVGIDDKPKAMDLNTARVNGYKEEIKRLCGRMSRRQIKEDKITFKDIQDSDREVYREPYRTLYHQFDVVLGELLAQNGYKLEDYGLGFKLDKNTNNYLDRVAKAGFIAKLHAVAKNLYGNI